MNLYSVTFWDYRKSQQGSNKDGWMFFKVLADNELQIIEYLDEYYINRKFCYFDREGNPSDKAHDWTEIKSCGEIKTPLFIEENK